MARTASTAARAAVLVGLLSVCSCVYLRDRGMDFLDQWRVGVGAGSVIGVRYKALGLVDTGVMMGIKPNASQLGWVYGAPFYFNKTDGAVTCRAPSATAAPSPRSA